MLCPCCQQEMVWGAVQSARSVFFTEKPRAITFFSLGPQKHEIRLTKEDAQKGHMAYAWHCPHCKRIFLQYR